MFIVHYNRELILVHYLVFTFDDNHKFPKKKFIQIERCQLKSLLFRLLLSQMMIF